MRRLGIVLLALTMTATGCVELPTWTNPKGRPTADAPPLVPVEAPPVTPDQVNDADAQRVLERLRNELDRAAEPPAPAPTKTP